MKTEQAFKYPDEVTLPQKPVPDLKVKAFGWLVVVVALYAACFGFIYLYVEEFPIIVSLPIIIAVIVCIFFIKGTSPRILVAILGGTLLTNFLVLMVVHLVLPKISIYDIEDISVFLTLGLVYIALFLFPFTLLLVLRILKIIGSSPPFLFSSVLLVNMLSFLAVFIWVALELARIG